MAKRGLQFVFLVLFAYIFIASENAFAQESNLLLRTVVIDAGHGGRDPGAVFGNTREKDINLDIATRLGDKIKKSYPNVKVIYTRDRDIYVPLDERGAKANRNHADLFISIHVNSAKSNLARGTETFLMGTDKSKSNMEVCKRENSVILMEDDYTTKYAGFNPNEPDSYIFFNMMQNAQFEQSLLMADLIEKNLVSGPVGLSRGIKQAPLLVLWRTTMPAVLVEVGFISNKEDRSVLTSAIMREKTADCIFRAFAEFKKDYDGTDPEPEAVRHSHPDGVSDLSHNITPVDPKKSQTVETTPAAVDTSYRIQIFSLSRKLNSNAPELKDEKVEILQSNGVYKYCVGKYNSRMEAAKALTYCKQKFPGAFIVRVTSDGEFVR